MEQHSNTKRFSEFGGDAMEANEWIIGCMLQDLQVCIIIQHVHVHVYMAIIACITQDIKGCNTLFQSEIQRTGSCKDCGYVSRNHADMHA